MADPLPAAARADSLPPPRPIRGWDRHGARLPPTLSAFIGREDDVAAVEDLLRRDDVRSADPDRAGRRRQDAAGDGDRAGGWPATSATASPSSTSPR